MRLFDTAKELIQRDDVREMSKDILSDLISGLLGDPVAVAKVLIAITSTPFFIRDQLFWQKFERFLQGIDFYFGDTIKFSEKISEEGKKEENAKRIIHIIDLIDTDKKVDYTINVSKALCLGLVNLETYFRICRAITDCYISDLEFIKLNYDDNKLFALDISILDLTSNGLMFQSIIDGGTFDDTYIPKTHRFTELAQWVHKYALTFDESC